MKQSTDPVDLLVIGGGASAVALMAALGRKAHPLSLVIVERSAAQGLGIAYGTECDHHILNVPAQMMGIEATEPGGFMDWILTNEFPLQGTDFVSRQIYGRYLQEVLQRELSESGGVLWKGEIVALKAVSQGFSAQGADGQTVLARQVVLAIGHAPLEVPRCAIRGTLDQRLIRNPWSQEGYQHTDQIESIGILGTGLTAMDVVGQLDKQGFTGEIVLISRRGLLPLASQGEGAAVEISLSAETLALPLLKLVRWTIAQARQLSRNGKDWRSLVDAFRPHLPAIWRRLTARERGQFLRHLRPYWEVLRHRMPVQVRLRVEQLQREGRLKIVRGRVRELDFDRSAIVLGITISQASGNHKLVVNRLFNCTGSGALKVDRLPGVLCGLHNQGLLVVDRDGLGIHTTPEGAVIDCKGDIVTGCYVIGPLRRAADWESTAMREIREQAAVVAKGLLREGAVI